MSSKYTFEWIEPDEASSQEYMTHLTNALNLMINVNPDIEQCKTEIGKLGDAPKLLRWQVKSKRHEITYSGYFDIITEEDNNPLLLHFKVVPDSSIQSIPRKVTTLIHSRLRTRVKQRMSDLNNVIKMLAVLTQKMQTPT